MKGMLTREFYSGYNSDDGISFTFEVNFPPSFGVAQASFYYVTGGGLHKAGIVGYRHRPENNGAEQTVNFGDWPTWPGCIYVDKLTSVTFGTAVGAEQECSTLANVFFW
jgi:hypothetical protein